MKRVAFGIGFSAVAAAAAAASAYAGEAALALSLLPILVILAYIPVGLLAGRRDPAGLVALGEDVFYIGHLCTFAAVCGLTLRLLGADHGLTADAALVAGLVAMSTALVGLLGMRALKACAAALGPAPGGEAEWVGRVEAVVKHLALPPAVADALRARVELAAAGLDGLGGASRAAAAGVGELRGEVQALRAEAAATARRARGAGAAVEAEMAALATAVREVRGVLDGFVALTRRSVEKELAGAGVGRRP